MAASTLPRCLALALLLCVSVTLAGPVATTTTRTPPTRPPASTDTVDVTPSDVIADDTANATTADTPDPIHDDIADVIADDTDDITTVDFPDATDDDTAATETDDVTEEAMQLISDIRQFAVVAKKGMALSSISEGAGKLKERAEELLQELPDNADGCKANIVIKMAAARIGSPEILALLQAEGQTDVLHGRLAMSFGFLESVAQMIEDELALSIDIGGHLSAVVFGADITESIAQTSDTLLRASSSSNGKSDVKRQNWNISALPFITKDAGVGLHGTLGHTSKNGRTSFNVNPFLNLKGDSGLIGLLNLHSKNGIFNASVNPYYTKYNGWGLLGSVSLKNKKGSISGSFDPSLTQSKGLTIGGTVELKSKNNKITVYGKPFWDAAGGFKIVGGVKIDLGN